MGEGRTLIIGIGNAWRGDDGAGPAVVARVAPHLAPGQRAIAVGSDPLPLMDAWVDTERVIVVDAVVSGSPPGTVHHLVDATRLPPGIRPASSHLLGLGELLALAEALGVLPARIEFFGIEAERVEPATELGPAVEAGVQEVCGRILESLAGA